MMLASVRWLGAAAFLLVPGAWGQGEVYVLSGGVPEERMGVAVAGVGDIDLDGVSDIAGGGTGGGQARVRVWSGATGAQLLVIEQAPSSTANFTSLAPAGDVDADGVPDILAANYLHKGLATGAMWAGAVWVYSGADGEELYFFEGTDSSELVGFGVAGGADLNGDGHADFAIGVPGRRRDVGLDYVLVGGVDVRSGKDGSLLYQIEADSHGSGGAAPALLNDLDGDGVPDFVCSGNATAPSGPDTMLRWFSGASGETLLTYYHTPGESIGFSVDSAGDFDGDGLFDVVVGNPDEDFGSFCLGTVRVFSSADASPLLLFTNPGAWPCAGVGASVAGLGDFDGDGVPDLGVGTEEVEGLALVISGKTGSILFEQTVEGFGTFFGYSVAGPGDLNGDGLGDFVVGHPLSHPDGVFLAGGVHVYLADCPPPVAYCTAKTNSQGCQPGVEWSGLLSLSIADNFAVQATDVVSQQLGMLLWSHRRADSPFQGGTLCLAAPLNRLTPMSSGGNGTPDCSGVLAYDLDHDLAASEGWFAGDDVFLQFWYRDPSHPDGTAAGLSDALRFQVCP